MVLIGSSRLMEALQVRAEATAGGCELAGMLLPDEAMLNPALLEVVAELKGTIQGTVRSLDALVLQVRADAVQSERVKLMDGHLEALEADIEAVSFHVAACGVEKMVAPLGSLREACASLKWRIITPEFKAAVLAAWVVARARLVTFQTLLRMYPSDFSGFYDAGLAGALAAVGFGGFACELPAADEHSDFAYRSTGMTESEFRACWPAEKLRKSVGIMLAGLGGDRLVEPGYVGAHVVHVQDYRFLLEEVQMDEGLPKVRARDHGGYAVVDHSAPWVSLTSLVGPLLCKRVVHSPVRLALVAGAVLTVPKLASQPGYCYLKLVPPVNRAEAAEALGPNPTVAELFKAFPAVRSWVGTEAQLDVGPGTYHVRTEGCLPYGASPAYTVGTKPTLQEGVDAYMGEVLQRLAAAGAQQPARQERERKPMGEFTIKRGVTTVFKRPIKVDVPPSDLTVRFDPIGEVTEAAWHPDAAALAGVSDRREASLRERLDRGSVVTRGYIRKSMGATSLRSLSPDKGTAVAFPPGGVCTGSVLDWHLDGMFRVSGWIVYHVYVKGGTEFVVGPPAGFSVARMDWSVTGALKHRAVQLDTTALVVWLSGVEKFLYEGERAHVRMFVPRKGAAEAVGYQAELLQRAYSVPCALLFDPRTQLAVLTVPLVFKDSSEIGVSRYKAKYYVRDTGTMRIKFGVDVRRATGPAVVSMSGVGLHSLACGALCVPAVKGPENGHPQTGLLAARWDETLDVEVIKAGEVKFTVVIVTDRVAFEEAHTVTADTPVLSQMELPTKGVIV